MDGNRPEGLTKSTLVTVSHAIERAALAPAEDGPMAVVALFQRLPYFERERAVYERIGRRAAVTVVGVVHEQRPDVPDGIHGLVLRDDEELAREWTVVVLTPRFGAVLVAHDREEVDGRAATLESGRLFDGWWRFRRDDALHEAIRLRGTLADRLSGEARAGLDDVIARVRDLPPAPGEGRGEAAVRLILDRSNRDRARLDDRQQAAPGGLTSAPEVGRWAGEDGVTASGTLQVAMLGVRITHSDALPAHLGRSAGARRAEGVVTALTARLRPADRATRLDEDEYLLVLPGLSADDAVSRAYQLSADISGAGAHNPFVTEAAATVVVAVTRNRPLPTDRVREALKWAVAQQVPVAVVPDV